MKNKKMKITLVLILALTVAAICFYFYSRSSRDASTISTPAGDVDYGESTKQDKDYNEDIKKSLSDETADNDSSRSNVSPVISAWGQPAGNGTDLAVNGYVPSVIESDGTCTITLMKDGLAVSASKQALRNAQNTSCGQLKIAYSSLNPGVWKATLSYKSSSSEGSSESTDIEVK